MSEPVEILPPCKHAWARDMIRRVQICAHCGEVDDFVGRMERMGIVVLYSPVPPGTQTGHMIPKHTGLSKPLNDEINTTRKP